MSLTFGPRSDWFPTYVRVRWLSPPFGLIGRPDHEKSLLGRVPPGTLASSSERLTKSRVVFAVM
ncbi:MAG: hypothetical protein KTR25_03535 [Myxococcales bacterium]|nr:hypothetical protein [Myxococcales bacterium]